MKDSQKVYIRGVKNRGAEVIKLLEDLGGINSYHCSGNHNNLYYYIGPDGNINCEDIRGNEVYLFLKEFYKEISLERKKWKPENNEDYWYINDVGEICHTSYNQFMIRDNKHVAVGNCFKTEVDAFAARLRIKEILLSELPTS